jgi:hypothetical protein
MTSAGTSAASPVVRPPPLRDRLADALRTRGYIAALRAARPGRPSFQRIRARHPDKPAIADGHALRLLFPVAQTGRPSNPRHYPWGQPRDTPAATPAADTNPAGPSSDIDRYP